MSKTNETNPSEENSKFSVGKFRPRPPRHLWVEYAQGETRWLVQHVEKIQQLFPGLTTSDLASLHHLAESREEWKTAWAMVKWLCGIRPAIIPLTEDETKYRPLTEPQVAAVFNCEPRDVVATISYLQLAWQQQWLAQGGSLPTAAGADADKAAAPGKQHLFIPPGPTDWFTPEQLDLLRLASIPTALFLESNASEFDRRVEIDEFCKRIDEIRKAFEEPMAKGVARMAILNELKLRRLESDWLKTSTDDKNFFKLQDTKTELEKSYGELWAQLETLCPQIMANINRQQTLRSLSDFVTYLQKWNADPEHRTFDGVFTFDEWQILHRPSVQQAKPQYRLGWMLAVNEAKLHLFDPKYKRQLSLTFCKLADSSYHYAFTKLFDRYGVNKPDLELEGPEGEHPEIYTESDGEITEPESPDLPEAVAESIEINEPTDTKPNQIPT